MHEEKRSYDLEEQTQRHSPRGQTRSWKVFGMENEENESRLKKKSIVEDSVELVMDHWKLFPHRFPLELSQKLHFFRALFHPK